jgi:hypothetical protein
MAAIGLLVLLAVGDAAGRFRFVPTPDRSNGTAYASSDLLVVVPVPSQRVKVGDVIIASNKHEHALLRIEQVVDSEGPVVRFANDPSNAPRRLGANVWRVSRSVPYLGAGLGLLAGPMQGILFVLVGFGLIIRAEFGRGRDAVPPTGESQEPAPA